MVNNELAQKIVGIAFVVAVMITVIGFLGMKKSKKTYLVLWLGIAPLIVSGIFMFYTDSSRWLIDIILVAYCFYILFLVTFTFYFVKRKGQKPDFDNELYQKCKDKFVN